MQTATITLCLAALSAATCAPAGAHEKPPFGEAPWSSENDRPSRDSQPQVTTNFTAADYSTYTGTLKFVFSIDVKSGIPGDAVLICKADVLVRDSTYGAYYPNESKSIAAVRSGSTAACSVSIPYRWSLLTAQATAGYLSLRMNYSVYTQYPDSKPPGSMERSIYGYIPVGVNSSDIKVPASGATTTFNIDVVL